MKDKLAPPNGAQWSVVVVENEGGDEEGRKSTKEKGYTVPIL